MLLRRLGILVIGGMLTSGVYGADFQFMGAIAGQVKTPNGANQMGATVLLLNRNERPISRTISDANGHFRFDSLTPDYYSVRVSQTSFVTASRDHILVKAGLDSFLTIQMAAFLSSIELVYQQPGQSGLLADDWKSVLRSSSATRPVLRYAPVLDTSSPNSVRTSNSFSATRGLVRVSAGDSGGSDVYGAGPDLGTAFALATSVFGANELQFSGNLGYASSISSPAAGFRTRYSRAPDSTGLTPDVELTVRQLGLRSRVGQNIMAGNAAGVPTLRTMSLRLGDHTQVTDSLRLEYGANVESVVFLDRLNYISPYARATYEMGKLGQMAVGYSSGVPPVEFLTTPSTPETALGYGLSDLALFPRLTLRNNRPQVQRVNSLEVGYRLQAGRRTYSAAVYDDHTRDLSLTTAGATGVIGPADLLPDIASNSSLFNAGRFHMRGFMVGVNQSFWENWSAGMAYGLGGALTAAQDAQPVNSAEDLRQSLQTTSTQWIAGRVSGVVPGSGTRFIAAYVWNGSEAMLPSHAFITQSTRPQAGLNIQIRQPLPSAGVVPGHWEMTAEMRNLLGQGYLPLQSADGRSLVLIQFPKTLRGGLNFIF